MKTITFESIRNLLRSKKKTAQDYGDASFKRSDSFRRISIRRSYLNRNRKRAAQNAAKVNGNNTKVDAYPNPHESNHSHDASKSCPVQVHAQLHQQHQSNGIASAALSSNNHIEPHTHPIYDNAIVTVIDEAVKIARSTKSSTRKSHDDMNGKAHGHSKHANRHQPFSDDDSNALPPYRYASNANHGSSGAAAALATSSECFVKAGNRLKKPIGTGLNVTSDELADSDFMKHSYEKSLNNLKFDGSLIDINLDARFARQAAKHSANAHYSNASATNDLNASHRPFRSLSNDTSLKSKPRLDQQQRQQSKSIPYIDATANNRLPPHTQQAYGERPSFVIFKTYSNEHNPDECLYLETCFNNTKDHIAKTLDTTIPIQINACPNEHITIDVSGGSGMDSAKSKCHPTAIDLKNRGVVIQISDSGCNIDNLVEAIPSKGVERTTMANKTDMNIASDDETSLNGKFTFEIYKQIRTAQKCDRPCSGRSRLTVRSTEGSDIRSYDSREGSNSNRHSALDQTLSDSFRSLCISKQLSDPNFFLEAPESPIPYPLRIKTNPFTNQKEPYSVNLGRVWKQLNLGQDEPSLDTSLNTQYNKPVTNAKPKNDSFRSISSHDSGFSLTLTKQKSLFQRQPPKKPQRKSKLSDKRDTNGKRIAAANMVHSLRRNKRKQMKQRAMYTSSAVPREHTKKHPTKIPFSGIDVSNGTDVHIFDRNHLLDTANDSDISISQEISDLEVFFEEHLKRLKEYYLHRKKLNEHGGSSSRGDGDHTDKNRSTKQMHSIDEKRRKRKKSSRTSTARSSRSNEPDTLGSHKRNSNASKASSSNKHRQNNRKKSTNSDDRILEQFDFPRPDKRGTLNNHNHGTRCPANVNGTQFSAVQYASLDFSNDQRYDSYCNTNQSNCPKSNANHAYCDTIHQSNVEPCDNCNGNSDDEYEDLPSDEDDGADEYGEFNFDQAQCEKCQQPVSECVCSEKPDIHPALPTPSTQRCYMTPDNLLCNCMGTLHGGVMQTKRKKARKGSNKKTHKIYKMYDMHSMPKPVIRRKRRIRYLTKNHSLRRDYCYISSKCFLPYTFLLKAKPHQ